MSDLFSDIIRIQPKIPGWCVPEKAEALAALVVGIRACKSVEIGVWGGSSFIPIAMAHKHIGQGMVVGIDPWSPSESVKNENQQNVEWWGKQDHEAVYQAFLKLLRENDLDSICKIIRKPSDDAIVPGVIDLLHIDGSHTAQAIRDVRRFAPQVRMGGFCVMDDMDWSGGHVVTAASILEKELGFAQLYPIGTGAVFQRVR